MGEEVGLGEVGLGEGGGGGEGVTSVDGSHPASRLASVNQVWTKFPGAQHLLSP